MTSNESSMHAICGVRYEIQKESYCWKRVTYCEEPLLPTLQAVLYVLIMIVSFMANSLLVSSVCKSIMTNLILKGLLINMSVMFCGFSLFMFPISAYGVYFPGQTIPTELCRMIPFFKVVMVVASEMTLALISLDRYFTIFHPFTYPLKMSPLRTTLILLFIWMYALLCALPPMFGWGRYCFQSRTVPVCGLIARNHVSYAGFLAAIICILVPVSIMIFSYMKIANLARSMVEPERRCHSSQQRIRQPVKKLSVPHATNKRRAVKQIVKTSMSNVTGNQNGKHEGRNGRYEVRKNMKALKIVIVNVGVVLICWLPYVCMTIWHMASTEALPYIPYWLERIALLTKNIVIIVNPIVFLFTNKEYKCHARRLICRLVRRRTVDDTYYDNSYLPNATVSYNERSTNVAHQGKQRQWSTQINVKQCSHTNNGISVLQGASTS